MRTSKGRPRKSVKQACPNRRESRSCRMPRERSREKGWRRWRWNKSRKGIIDRETSLEKTEGWMDEIGNTRGNPQVGGASRRRKGGIPSRRDAVVVSSLSMMSSERQRPHHQSVGPSASFSKEGLYTFLEMARQPRFSPTGQNLHMPRLKVLPGS